MGTPVYNSAARTGLIKIDATVWFGEISYVFVMFHSYSGLAFLSSFHSKVFLGVIPLAPEENSFLSVQLLRSQVVDAPQHTR